MQHSVTVEPYTGTGAYGPQYGAPVDVKCFRDDARRFVRASDGAEVVSESTFYCEITPFTSTITPGTRVDIGTRQTTVLIVKTRDGAGLPGPAHLEVVLK